MDGTHRCRFEALGDESVVEADEFMGVDAISQKPFDRRADIGLVLRACR